MQCRGFPWRTRWCSPRAPNRTVVSDFLLFHGRVAAIVGSPMCYVLNRLWDTLRTWTMVMDVFSSCSFWKLGMRALTHTHTHTSGCWQFLFLSCFVRVDCCALLAVFLPSVCMCFSVSVVITWPDRCLFRIRCARQNPDRFVEVRAYVRFSVPFSPQALVLPSYSLLFSSFCHCFVCFHSSLLNRLLFLARVP